LYIVHCTLYIEQKKFKKITYTGNFNNDSPNGEGKINIEGDGWFDSKNFDVYCIGGVCVDKISREIIFNYNNQNNIWYGLN
jgi:hypothetical protein